MRDAEKANWWRDRAEECRRLAEMSEEGTLSYLRLAEAYELLAEQEEWLQVSSHGHPD